MRTAFVRRPVLVTGHRGYLGSVMAPLLVERGYDVVGLDVGYYDDCTIPSRNVLGDPLPIPQVDKDIRDLVPADLRAFYAVIHLAALSNDPIGNLDETWTEEINHRSSVRLAELAREAEVRRFLFSSSCIMYGQSSVETVTETSPLDPRTLYARSKVRSEEAIRDLASDGFSPTFLRNGTVYGLSPRMRFDTVLNDLTGAAVANRRVVVHGDGKPWRPVVHVRDVAAAFCRVLEAPRSVIHNEAFNTGADHLNHRVIELAEIAADLVPGCDLEVRGEPGADRRTYRASFEKFARAFPDFEFRWDAADGAAQLVEDFRHIGLDARLYGDRRFVRLRWLDHLLDSGRLDGSLRWADASRKDREQAKSPSSDADAGNAAAGPGARALQPEDGG